MKRSMPLLPFVALLVPTAAAQWSTPVVEAAVNSTAVEFDPSPTFDGLTLYFSSFRPNYELFRATRAAPYSAFGAPTLITELSDPGTDAGPCPRIDDRELFFYSTRPGGLGTFDLWRAERASSTGPYNTPVPITELNSAVADWGPTITADGLRIYFNSDRTGGAGMHDLWTATRSAWGVPFGAPTPVTELNSANTDRDAHVSADGLVIFFTSDRPGTVSGLDLWMASRLDVASPFGNIVNLTALNSTAGDFTAGFGLFYDEMFLSSNRVASNWDIYSSRFTGLVGIGIASASSTQELRFSDPSSPGRVHVAVSSRGTSPGIPIDTRNLPLNFDVLFQLTIGGLPPVLTGYVGALDPNGIASGRISFAGFPQLVGFQFFTGFVVLDPPAPSGIKTISNAHEVRVQ